MNLDNFQKLPHNFLLAYYRAKEETALKPRPEPRPAKERMDWAKTAKVMYELLNDERSETDWLDTD